MHATNWDPVAQDRGGECQPSTKYVKPTERKKNMLNTFPKLNFKYSR